MVVFKSTNVIVLSFLLGIFLNFPLRSQNKSPKKIGPWFDEVIKITNQELNKIVPPKIVAIMDIKKNIRPKFHDLYSAKIKKDPYFYSVNKRNFDVQYGLNHPYEKNKTVLEDEWLEYINKYLTPGLLVLAPRKSKNWAILTENSLVNSALEAKSSTSKISYSSLRSLLTKVYGYDGIVIAQENDFLLAFVIKPDLKKDSQATILKNSSNMNIFKESDRQIDGLLQMDSYLPEKSVAVFNIILRKSDTPIPWGTKLFIEKKQ